MVVERDDDKRKDLAWEDRLAADAYSCVALCPPLTPGLYYLFILLCLSLSVCLSRMEWEWHGSFVAVVKWRVNGHGLGGWLAGFCCFWCLRGGMG